MTIRKITNPVEADRPLMRSELIAALGKCRGSLGGSGAALAGMLADELEGAK